MLCQCALGSAFVAACIATGCARVVAPVPSGPPSEPRVSWVIRSGPQGGNESEVCRSDRQQPCVLRATTPARPTSVVVSVYMYAAGAPTKYSGAFHSGFIQTANNAGYEAKVDYAVNPGRLPTASTAGGLVTSTAGDYQFRIVLFAEVPGHMDPHQFQETIPLRVTTTGESTPAQSRGE